MWRQSFNAGENCQGSGGDARRGVLAFQGQGRVVLRHARGCVFAFGRTNGCPVAVGSVRNPLDAIEASVKEFFRVLEDCSVVREVFEIMISRCEYVDEFTSVQEEVGRPAQTFLTKIEAVYLQAAAKGMLRPGLDPLAMARDTWAFTSGLLHLMLNCQKGSDLPQRVPEMITAHMAIRRVSAVP
jgi:hypothetical protein